MNFSNSRIGILLLLLAIFSSRIYVPFLLIILFIQIFGLSGVIPRRVLLTILPLIVMLGSGMISLDTTNPSGALKDVWYVGKVIIVALVGALIGLTERPDPRWLGVTAKFCAMSAVIDVLTFTFLSALGQKAQLLPMLGVVLIIPFYIFYPSVGGRRLTWQHFLWATPVLLEVILSGSRTTLLVAAIAFLGAHGIFQSMGKLTIVALLVLISSVILFPMLPQYDIYNITLLGKIQNTFNELFFVKDDDLLTMTANWRGFEAFRAYQMWQFAPFVEQIFGLGLGTPIDIGFYFELSEGNPMRFLPILHNAYFTVLVKFGAIGVFMFLTFMTLPLWSAPKSSDATASFAKRVGTAASLILVVTTLSISGPLNLSLLDGVTLIFGWSLGVLMQRRLQLAPETHTLTTNLVTVVGQRESSGF